MSDWWQAVEEELERRSAAAPDPWADAELADDGLTDAQRAFLAQLSEQPPVTHLDDD